MRTLTWQPNTTSPSPILNRPPPVPTKLLGFQIVGLVTSARLGTLWLPPPLLIHTADLPCVPLLGHVFQIFPILRVSASTSPPQRGLPQAPHYSPHNTDDEHAFDVCCPSTLPSHTHLKCQPMRKRTLTPVFHHRPDIWHSVWRMLVPSICGLNNK